MNACWLSVQVAQLAKAIRAMTPEQLLQYEANGQIDLPPHHFSSGEIKVSNVQHLPSDRHC